MKASTKKTGKASRTAPLTARTPRRETTARARYIAKKTGKLLAQVYEDSVRTEEKKLIREKKLDRAFDGEFAHQEPEVPR